MRMLKENKHLRVDLLVDGRMSKDRRSKVQAIHGAFPRQVTLVHAKTTLHVKVSPAHDSFAIDTLAVN